MSGKLSKAGNAWIVSTVAASPEQESNPHTNGALITYDLTTGGPSVASSIAWRPVVGGDQVKLERSTYDYNPTISGNFISFESRSTIGARSDIFLYHITTNLLYQITNTPNVTEQLNDIALLSNGQIRIVWASDEDGSSARNIKAATITIPTVPNFSGFLQPVDGLPFVNVVSAGQAIPVRFSLGGYMGLNIFAQGYPISLPTNCDDNEPGAEIEQTLSAGNSSLSYDAATDLYTYIWKTDRAWKGTCRILNLRLSDGTDHLAKFRFR
jgi:hypothetical protein